MNKLNTTILTVVAGLATAPGFAACVYPEAVSVPDGARASETEMVAAKRSVSAYIAGVEDYLKCMDTEAATGAASAEDLQARKTAARESMRALADSYNAQVLAFKSVNE